VNNHTFRFAQKAESEGIPTIDDTLSILRCCNKVYLQELLKTKNIRMPNGYFLYRRQKNIPDPENLPLVLKVPDGSFSRGVFKVTTTEEFHIQLEELFKKSELVLVQEFLPSSYDWRIVILGGKPLFACKYHMAPGHWQIYNHSAKNDDKYGLADCVPVDEVPQKIMTTALKACKLIGEGLYGVDLKESNGKVYVIEINDNPNIDSGVEDQILGDSLYDALFDHFRTLIDA
jgi:glutathione synthase/RimK-type ligase-like ATP-grasp enzyme